MIAINKKRIAIIALFALIVAFVVNFPHFLNSISEQRPPMPPMPFKPGPHRGGEPFMGANFVAFQMIWYFAFSFILLLFSSGSSGLPDARFRKREIFMMLLKIILLTTFFYVCENLILRHLIDANFATMRKKFDAILMGRYLFVLILSLLIGMLMKLVENQNIISLENEQLKTENLQIRYNALTNQMNPHFFFNSLNSLQYLVMEGEHQKSIIYIEQLSSVFRYILQSSKKELVTLEEELRFLEAYRYLIEIRFDDKIRFDVNVPEKMRNYKIPVLTLQPLVENAINHNACSYQHPLEISIWIKNDILEVSNNLIPKIRKEKSEGIGLENLKKRFVLLLTKEIQIIQDNKKFKILLPLKIDTDENINC